jgi:hypothetical protein
LTCGPDRSAVEGEKKGEADRCELLGHGLLHRPCGEGAGPQAHERERGGRLGHAGLRAEKKRKGEMGRVRKKREGEKGGFEFSSLFFKLLF